MKKYIKYLPVILLVVLAFFLRTYKAEAFFNYAHDNDLASWIIKDVLVNHHLRLIGQQTSVLGIFIGGLFYYLQIPFYLLGQMDPFYVVYLTVALGILSVISFFFVFSKIFDYKVGFIAALIYSVSKLIVFSDRQVFPTMPVMLWTVWYLYDLHLIYKGRQKEGFVLFGILFALIWHINIALYIIIPLAVLSWFLSKKKIEWKHLLLGIGLSAVLNLPLIMFEMRHGFQQTKSIIVSLTTQNNLIPETATGFAKLDRVVQLVEKNTSYIFLPSLSNIPIQTAFCLLIGIFIFLVIKKKISLDKILIFVLWQILYIAFFSINSLNVSEYYLDGMNVIWIAISAVFLAYLFEQKLLKIIIILTITSYSVWNTILILNPPLSKNGYIYKKAIIKYIKEDSMKHNYPCVSVSYITDPGYNLGYRYLFYISDMHANQPKSGSPVYTIVFPLSLVDKFDQRFGDLGLILPDYKKYNQKNVEKSCQGENANLTDPMFGYTE
jgi:hypothetical protein